ncbi:MHYT domain-containing protein [Pseudomonas aeruginosa]
MKLIASLLLAGAIAAMHFTGMAALVLSVPAGTPLELQASADSLRLGWLTGCSPRRRRLRHLGRMVGETTGAPAQRKQPG